MVKWLPNTLMQAQLALEMQAKALEGQTTERAAAALTKSRLAATEKRLRGLEWEHEARPNFSCKSHLHASATLWHEEGISMSHVT